MPLRQKPEVPVVPPSTEMDNQWKILFRAESSSFIKQAKGIAVPEGVRLYSYPGPVFQPALNLLKRISGNRIYENPPRPGA